MIGMKEGLNQWLEQKTDVTEILVAGILHPDRTVFSRVFSDRFSEEAASQIWAALGGVVQSGKRHNFRSGQWRWSFEQFLVHGEVRTDGAILMLVTDGNVSETEIHGCEKLFSEFRDFKRHY
jgi:hypothetical protein